MNLLQKFRDEVCIKCEQKYKCMKDIKVVSGCATLLIWDKYGRS